MENILEIKNLHAKVEEKEVLKGLNITVKPGEVHAIMGPNGSGKSSFSKIIAGHRAYTVTDGEVLYGINLKMRNLLELSVDERAKEGVFLAMQYPIEVPGVSNFHFLQMSYNSILKHHGSKEFSENEFRTFVKQKMQIVQMREDFLDRDVNVGFQVAKKSETKFCKWRFCHRDSVFWMRPTPVLILTH